MHAKGGVALERNARHCENLVAASNRTTAPEKWLRPKSRSCWHVLHESCAFCTFLDDWRRPLPAGCNTRG